MEVVYETAIYDMKNEKLPKLGKETEIKKPGLINNLIGSNKAKKLLDSKETLKSEYSIIFQYLHLLRQK